MGNGTNFGTFWHRAGSMALQCVVALALCLSAAPVQAQAGQAQAGPVGPVPAPPASAAYTLGAGDKVRITVFGEAGLTGDYAVSASGEISFPLIGVVHADGRAPEQVAAEIRDRLAQGYLNDPRVAIELATYRTFFILGEVNRPGAYPFTAGLTLGQAVATAGGYTYRAKKSKVVVRHMNATGDSVVAVRDSGSLPIAPGDTITIPERFF